jgi:hypothetical protein
MGDWDTTYASAMSPFSFNAGNDQIAGLSPFGKQLGMGLAKGMQSAGAAMSGPQGGAQGAPHNPFAAGAQGFAQGLQQQQQQAMDPKQRMALLQKLFGGGAA